MQIKIQLGKLALSSPLADSLVSHEETNGIQILPLQLNHILALNRLPPHHNDPFDRLLVAQAQIEDLTLVTNDPKIQLYDVTCRW
jgi:PIN domain nuclease of toxin-antitoxin system